MWDLIFGTFHLPADEQPTTFGVRDPVPARFLGQLAWPFRNRTVTAAPRAMLRP